MNYKQLVIVFIIAYISSFSVKAQEVTMFPGFWGYKYYQDDEQINKKQLESLLIKNDDIYLSWKKSKQFETLAIVAIGAETGFLVWELNNISNNKSPTGPLIGVLASGVVGIIFIYKSINLKKKAILKYNKNLEKATTFKIRPSNKGIGIVLQF